MTDAALRTPAVTTQWRVTLALAGRALRITLRRVQFLLPSFVLPLLLLVVIASGTSAAQELPGFPVQSSYVGFVVSGTIIQGALLVGLMAMVTDGSVLVPGNLVGYAWLLGVAMIALVVIGWPSIQRPPRRAPDTMEPGGAPAPASERFTQEKDPSLP